MLFRGIVVGAASGKLGAMVASHNKGGQYMRARVVPSGAVASPAQEIVRNAVASLAAQWGQLTDDQRAAWSEYALNVPGTNALGDTIQLSGQNWYIACNVPRLQGELSRIDDAPTIFNRGTPTVALAIDALTDAGGTISFGGTLGGGSVTALLYQGHIFGPGRNKYYGSYQIVASQPLGPSGSGFTFTPVFPIGTDPAKCAFKLVISQDDGRLSSPLGVTFLQ